MVRPNHDFEKIPFISLEIARMAARDQEQRVIRLLSGTLS